MYNSENYDNSRPVTPSDNDCCGNGCDYCVFDVHRKLKEEWERRKEKNIKSQRKKNLLSATSYITFFISDIKLISEEYLLICMKYKGNLENGARLFLNPGQHVVLSSGSISRPFTPISWTEDSFLLLVKLYLKGQFSSYLKNVSTGQELNVRGPYGDFRYECNKFKQVVMFSIGSGIAAVYSIAKSIVDNEDDETKVHFVSGFPSVSKIPLKQDLQNLSGFWNFACTIFLSRQQDINNGLHGINLMYGRLKKDTVNSFLEHHRPDVTLVLICGTVEFNQSVEEWAKELNYTHIHVFK